MNALKYKLIEIDTNKCMAYSNSNTIIFGGICGDMSKYQWVENILNEEENRQNLIQQLNNDYISYLNELALLYSKALIQDDTQTIQDLKDEYNYVFQCYQDELRSVV